MKIQLQFDRYPYEKLLLVLNFSKDLTTARLCSETFPRSSWKPSFYDTFGVRWLMNASTDYSIGFLALVQFTHHSFKDFFFLKGIIDYIKGLDQDQSNSSYETTSAIDLCAPQILMRNKHDLSSKNFFLFGQIIDTTYHTQLLSSSD